MTSSQHDTASDSTPDPAWDEERTIQRMGGQRALIKKLVTLFLRDAPEQIGQALTGIERHDYDCSHIAMHSLKGTSSNFCTKRFEFVCAELLDALKLRDWNQAAILHCQLAEEYVKLALQFEKFISH